LGLPNLDKKLFNRLNAYCVLPSLDIHFPDRALFMLLAFGRFSGNRVEPAAFTARATF